MHRPSGCGRTYSQERGHGWQRKTTNARHCHLFHPGRRRQGLCWIHSLTLPPSPSRACVGVHEHKQLFMRGNLSYNFVQGCPERMPFLTISSLRRSIRYDKGHSLRATAQFERHLQQRSLMNSGGCAAVRMIWVLTANPTSPWPFFSPSPPLSPLQYTTNPTSLRMVWPALRVSWSPITSQLKSLYTLMISSARPTPCVPSTAIVGSLWVAMVISR